MNKTASLAKFLVFAINLMKSRRLERGRVRSGTENNTRIG